MKFAIHYWQGAAIYLDPQYALECANKALELNPNWVEATEIRNRAKKLVEEEEEKKL